MDLYLDKLPELEKEFRKEAAFAARLSETPENWPQELTSELYKQLPYLSDYDVSVNLDRVDAQRGYAFGYADVANKTERPEIEHTEAGLPHIRVPIIIQERAVKPWSVFLDGDRAVALNEERVRETLFNPSTFDLSQSMPRDPSLIESLMPPTRSGAGLGGEYKTASVRGPDVRPSLLQAIAPTLSEKDVESFLNKVASDPTFRAGLKRAGVVGDVVEAFDLTKRASASERLAAISENILPSVVTIQKLPGGDFFIKSANVNAFDPAAAQGQVVPGQEAGQMIGQGNAQAMTPGQTATIVPQPAQMEAPVLDRAKPIDEFGEFKVLDAMGNQIMGWVFPTTLAWDGQFSEQPVALFTNGSAYAVQDSMSGELVGKGTNLPIDKPLGDGCFYYVGHGEAFATAPLTVKSMMAGPDGNPKIIASDLFGNQLTISQVEGLSTPQRISDVEYVMPMVWKFMRLNNQTQLQGAGQGGDMQPQEPAPGAGGMSDAPAEATPKPAAKKADGKKPEAKKTEPKKEEEKPTVQVNVGAKAKQEKTAATLWYNGGFNLEGGCGLHKLAGELKYDLSPVEAEFMLGLLGVDGHIAKQKVAEARRKGAVKLAGLKTIVLASERYADAVKTASAALKQMPDLRRELYKEAAALQDQGTVNNLLALNFINPENVATFVDYLPELEQTSEKLSEMLLYSYLGMNELPEGALSRSLRSVEDVISGLKTLSESGNYMEE